MNIELEPKERDLLKRALNLAEDQTTAMMLSSIQSADIESKRRVLTQASDDWLIIQTLMEKLKS